MCTVQEDSFHAAITKQSFGNGSSDRVFMCKPTHRTCKRTTVERPGYFSGLLSLERHAVKWQLCTTESWVAAAHPVRSHLAVHLRTGTVAYCTLCLITSLLWLPLAWMNRHNPFFLRSPDKIHSCKLNEGLWESLQASMNGIYSHWMQDVQILTPALEPLCQCLWQWDFSSKLLATSREINEAEQLQK